MSEERKPQTEDKYIIRFPDGMRDRLKEAAKVNNRTMNAEIVARLESSFTKGAENASLPSLVEEHVSELEQENNIARTDALEAMAARSQDAQGPVVIIHYTHGMKMAELREMLNQLGDAFPTQSSVLVYPE